MIENAGQVAPWWFAGTIGVVGVVVGLFIKWALDTTASRAGIRREDRLRFIDDKRVAYADVLAATTEIADIEHDSRLHNLRGQELDAESFTPAEELADFNLQLDVITARRQNAYTTLNRAVAIVDLIAPEVVMTAAALLASRAHHPHGLDRRIEAETAFIDAARADLGYSKAGYEGTFTYEEYIPFDHPDSGVDVD